MRNVTIQYVFELKFSFLHLTENFSSFLDIAKLWSLNSSCFCNNFSFGGIKKIQRKLQCHEFLQVLHSL